MLYPNPQIYHHLKVIFVHVPKTAGTSIERHLRESDRDVVGGHTTALAFRAAFPKLFDSYYKFAFVRHPLDRFLSAYCYLKTRPVHPALNNEVIHETGTLARFVETIQRSPRTMSKIVHLVPAHYFVTDTNGNLLVDDIYKYEHLNDAWKEICATVGLRHSCLARANASHRWSVQTGCGESLNVLVSTLYAKDYELFGYARSSLGQTPLSVE